MTKVQRRAKFKRELRFFISARFFEWAKHPSLSDHSRKLLEAIGNNWKTCRLKPFDPSFIAIEAIMDFIKARQKGGH